MKRKLMLIFVSIVMILGLVGCGNQAVFDTTYTFNKALISLPNGDVIEVEIDEWCDYDGEQLQVKAKDGTVYLTSSFNCILIKESD